MKRSQFNQILVSGLQKLGLEPGVEQLERFREYMEFLLQENKKYNLTGITDQEQIIRRHFLDSAALFTVHKPGSGPVLDLGTGPGFPGLVLKILRSELDCYLVDSALKKVTFLRLLVNRFDFEKEPVIIHERAEKLGQDPGFREKFPGVVARALAPLNLLCEYCLPFVKKGGVFLAYKGPGVARELEQAQFRGVISTLGGEFRENKQVCVPGLEGERYIVIIDKVTPTPGRYPRRPGIPKKRPL